MPKITSRNNDFLKSYKNKTSQKTYNLLVELMNEDRRDLAEMVTKIDYLLEYTSNCIKQKDFREARESLSKAKDRIDKLRSEGGDTEHLDYLYEGIKKKCK
ncbi:hypothetical protein [Oceanirhabdus seepicola]|uniref:Uncharacterized protein n=1 Tax=Oceanirhabdus seepicola TaxID=2828781 RepID=A0A9J6P2Y2_9CLOT|nr:hypothetical protein [Oceanirhabdus seepicola]MCM1990975.1 hypothetical protein [Oceanirhabdus seepicola]